MNNAAEMVWKQMLSHLFWRKSTSQISCKYQSYDHS